MTTAQQISRTARQDIEAAADILGRICALVEFIVRINRIEHSKREGSPEATEAFRKELNRYIYGGWR